MKTAFLPRLLFILTALTGITRAEVSLEDGIKSRLAPLTEKHLPGISVLVARDGKIAYQGAFGMADVEKKTPVTAETKFRIGSVTKQFTAAAILRLAEEGKLSLTDPLKKFFPGFPKAEGITLHQLLTHTSGIHSYTSKPEFLNRVTKPITPSKLIEWFKDDPPDFAPGAGFLYNNSAYFLAGEIVAKVSGKTFAAYLEDTFFQPLGMKDTGIFVNASPPSGMAAGYSMAAGEKTDPALNWDMSWAGGAGALYSTTADLLRWNNALFGGKVLKESSYKTMTTPEKLPDGVDGLIYGCGLALSELRGLPVIGHSGGLNGWSCNLIYLPEQHCTVIALTNAMPGPAGFEPSGVTNKIAEKFLEADIKKVPPPKEYASDKKTYPSLAGRYDYKNAVMTVTAENDRLYAQLTGQPKNEIFPGAPDAFFWKVVDARVVFLRDAKGAVTAARHTQGGNTFKAPRLPEAEVKLTAAELDAIAGKYQYGTLGVLTVSHDGDAVFAQLGSQPKAPIFAKSATEFEWHVVKASVRFVKDKDGKVTKAIHSQGGGIIDAAKME